MSIIKGFLSGFDISASIVEDEWRISHIQLFSSDCGDPAVLSLYSPEEGQVCCRNGENSITVRSADIGAVFNAVNDKMNYYNQWELKALNEVGMRASSLDSLNILMELFPDYTVKIVNPLGKLLYSSAQDPDSYIDSSFISIIRNIPACYDIALGKRGITVFWEYEHYRRNIMLGNIVFSDSSYVMFSVIEKSRPITEVEQHLAFIAQSIFENLKLTIKLRTIIEPYESTLANLLNGETVAESMLMNLEVLWNRKITEGAYLVLISNTRNQKFGNKAIASNINEKISAALAFTYHKQVLCFLPASSFDKNSRTVEDLASPSNSNIIFSTWFNSWSNVAWAYKQLEQMLFIARDDPRSKRVIYCSDYIWDFYVWSLQRSNSQSIVHPDILALRALDEHDRFLDTFYCYLENNCRMSATAEALHIHLSTLKYRMERINSIISFDPENYRARMAFLTAYELMKAGPPTLPKNRG